MHLSVNHYCKPTCVYECLLCSSCRWVDASHCRRTMVERTQPWTRRLFGACSGLAMSAPPRGQGSAVVTGTIKKMLFQARIKKETLESNRDQQKSKTYFHNDKTFPSFLQANYTLLETASPTSKTCPIKKPLLFFVVETSSHSLDRKMRDCPVVAVTRPGSRNAWLSSLLDVRFMRCVTVGAFGRPAS